MKLNIQIFGGRGASSSNGKGGTGSASSASKTYVRGDHRFIVTKNSRGLYDYKMQEYSAMNNKWINISRRGNYTRDSINGELGIKVNF